MLSWNFCQEQSNEILAQGIGTLLNANELHWSQINTDKAGNYLISIEDKPYYVGEAINIKKRIKQQFSPRRSTFYKSFTDFVKPDNISCYDIEDFGVRYMETNIGRREIEEFGIVNLPTILNKFQLNKRDKFSIDRNMKELWDAVQYQKSLLLAQAEEQFFGQVMSKWNESILERINGFPGVYYVVNSYGELIYIGESSNVCKRYRVHSTRTYFSALRRNIASEILGIGFIERNKLSYDDDLKVNEFLRECRIGFMPVNFGRLELEEYLIKKRAPLLNKKIRN